MGCQNKNTKDFNRKRSNIISALKRKNLHLIKMVDQYKADSALTPVKEKHLDRLVKDASRCSNFSLYGNQVDRQEIKYFASVMCGNKCCFICNFARQKRIRRKYYRWFADNPSIFEIKKGEKVKYCTKSRYQEFYKEKGYQVTAGRPYDIMHLTLTVPHYAATGFNGNQYYFDEVIDRFHNMRNEVPAWNDLIFGGEYGIETTRSNAGLHIHIHGLLFVRQSSRNRNQVHRLILKEWNKRTVNQDNPRKSFTRETIDKIKKSNRSFTEDFVLSLNPQGTTMINVETIYSINQAGEKVRTTNFNSPEMLFAVMEAIKYHFEPLAFDKANHSFDFDLLSDIMPVIYKKQLYKKFGCLHGEKSLNIKDSDTLDEDFSDSVEILSMVDQETGEIRPEYQFFIMNPAYMFHVPEKDNHLVISNEGKKRLKNISALTVSGAVAQMGDMVKAGFHKHSQTIKN